MDITPFLHALCGCAGTDWSFTGNWVYGAIAGCTFFIAREHTGQNISVDEMFGHGKRMNMPWWGLIRADQALMDFAVRGGGVSAGLAVG
ncbi:hypothetical protein ECZU12_54690 [Escherichia coli]|nr:hypothetical protein ECZU12_54690 [Escherichia coli]